MYLLKFGLIFHISFIVTANEFTTKIKLIKDLVQKENGYFVIQSFLCWDEETIKKLALELYAVDILINMNSKIFDFNNKKLESNIMFLLDSSCDFLEILNKANRTRSFIIPNHWLIFNSNNVTPDIFNPYSFNINSKIYVAQKMNTTSYELKYIYKIKKETKIIEQFIAIWVEDKGFEERYIPGDFWWKRKDMKKEVLITGMVVTNNSTYEHMTDYRLNEIDTPTKLNYVLTNHLVDYLNATWKIIYYTNWYNPQSNNQNNTLLLGIALKEFDLSSSPFFCKLERMHLYKCLSIPWKVFGFFIFRKPPLSYVQNIFALPFEVSLWLTDVSVLFVCAVFLYVIVIWEWKRIRADGVEPESDMIPASFSDAVLFTIGAVCQQGYATEPKGGAGKILMLTIFITLIFLFTAYTAYTVVLFQSTADNVKTLEDLYNSKMSLGSDDKSYFRKSFALYDDKWRKKIYSERLAPHGVQTHFYDIIEGLEKVRNEYFAFIIDPLSGYKYISEHFLEQEKCSLQQIFFLLETDTYFASPPDTPHNKLLSVGLTRNTEFGLTYRERTRRINKKPECLSDGNNYRSAGILDLYSVYMMLVIGLGMSVVILIMEILVHKFHTGNYKKSFRSISKNAN